MRLTHALTLCQIDPKTYQKTFFIVLKLDISSGSVVGIKEADNKTSYSRRAIELAENSINKD
ncbi:MAG: hypothetical protein N3D14_05935 [Aquificaceae bacterium]|nr:hypothetical protein [Aquificaceae bacterium]